jgi:hypothetical protein
LLNVLARPECPRTFELGFAHDEEIRFKILARRNALLGQWAVDRLGYGGAVGDKYIEKIADILREPAVSAASADDRAVSKLVMDLTTAGWDVTREDVHKVLSDFEEQARAAVMAGHTV